MLTTGVAGQRLRARGNALACSHRRLMAEGFSPRPMIVDVDRLPISSMFSGRPNTRL
jgi:hypothetical protein